MDYDDLPEHIKHVIAMQQGRHEEYHANMNLMRNAAQSEIGDFIRGLSVDDLKTLRTIVGSCDTPEAIANMMGVISGAMMYLHGRSWNGLSAEEELLGTSEEEPEAFDGGAAVNQELAEEPQEPPTEVITEEDMRPTLSDEDFKLFQEMKSDFENNRVINPYDALKTDEDVKRAMGVWNVVEREDGSIVCAGCGTRLHSLKDRMLREPGVDGCAQCQHKMKWG